MKARKIKKLFVKIFQKTLKIRKWLKVKECTKKAIVLINANLPQSYGIKIDENKIQTLCSLGFPYYMVAEIILRDIDRVRVETAIKKKISDITDEEIIWLHEYLKENKTTIEEAEKIIIASRQNKKSLPELK